MTDAAGDRSDAPVSGPPAAAMSRLMLGGHRFVADPSGALYWPGREMLIAADLHLEKGSSLARRRTFLPPYDTAATLDLLGALIDRYRPARVVCLGDSFHDREGADRLSRDDLERLRALQAGRDWVWVAGNHDPSLSGRAGGRIRPSLTLDGVTLRHEPTPGPCEPEIAGHLHPAARLYHRGATVRRKCFAGDGRRLVLPALGAYAGGLNVLDRAFAALFGGDDLRVWMLGRGRVYCIARRRLLAE